jgi:hypothetical protein
MTTLSVPVIVASQTRHWRRPLCLFLFLVGVIAHGTTVVPPKFTELVGKSDYIVRAMVKAVTSELRNDGSGRHIITKVELAVIEIISGNPPQPLVLQMLGGKVGRDEMVVEGAPKFKVGDEDILFVRGNGRLLSPLFGMMYGRYPIKRDAATGREYMTRSNGAPLVNESEVETPLIGQASAPVSDRSYSAAVLAIAIPLSPSDFTGKIKAVLNRK